MSKSQFPPNAMKALPEFQKAQQALSQIQERQNVTQPNPAEQHVDNAQREQAMRFLQMMAGAKQEQSYQPVLKSLKLIGIKPKKMTVMIGEEPEECIVIPVQELMSKEWAHLNEMETEE